MKDQYGRTVDYLRLSVTDLCSYRCQYCMPAEGVRKLRHEDILSVEECVEIAHAASRCGVTKVRITGGEPLVRRGILDICRGIAAIPEVRELCLTTNGALLPELAAPLREKGGAVQHHPVSVYYRFAGEHRGLPPDQMAILLVKPFCLHISLYLQGQLA